MRGPHYRKAPLMKGELSPKATERFGRNDFENLSVICFANATSPEVKPDKERDEKHIFNR